MLFAIPTPTVLCRTQDHTRQVASPFNFSTEKEDTKMNREELVTIKINNKGEMDDIKWIGW